MNSLVYVLLKKKRIFATFVITSGSINLVTAALLHRCTIAPLPCVEKDEVVRFFESYNSRRVGKSIRSTINKGGTSVNPPD